MRHPMLAVSLLLLSSRSVLAQQPNPAQPPQITPQQQAAALDAILANWGKAVAGINKFHIPQASRTYKDAVIPGTEVYLGDIKFLAPRRFFWDLKLYEKGRVQPETYDRLVCTGTATYQYMPKAKTILQQQLPAKKGTDDTIMGFMFPDMKVEDFRRRYQLALVPPPPPHDQYYYFIDVVPLVPQDKQIFSRARLVLNRSNFLPRQLSYVEPNGSQMTWDFPRILTTEANVQPAEFSAPTLPPGWSFQQKSSDRPPPPRNPTGGNN
jgi:TIGR03009 family protein